MNLDTFRSRVAQSAAAAAAAARQVSSLDEMAQNDAYVQSEGLNIKNKKKMQPKSSSEIQNDAATNPQQEMSKVVGDLSDKFVDALSTAANPKARARKEVMESTTSNNEKKSVASDKAHKPKLVSSVAALYQQKDSRNKYSVQRTTKHDQSTSHSKQYRKQNSSEHVSLKPTGVVVGDKHAHILHQLEYFSDDDSSDEERGDRTNELGDLELARNNSLSDQLERELNETLQHQAEENHRKHPHRFMTMTADLEERESLLPSHSIPQNNSLPKSESNNRSMPDSHSTAGQETGDALKAGLSWIKNVASPQLQAFSKKVITKVAESESRYFTGQEKSHEQHSTRPMIGPRHDKLPKTADTEDEIIMTTSATFLAEDDMAELERIRTKHSSSQMAVLVRSCLESLWENPRLAFIAATLIFALFVYYYSRKRSVDDVL